MSQLNVDIPEDLKRTIKSTAASDGVSLQIWTIAALRDASAVGMSSNSTKTEKFDKAKEAIVCHIPRKPRKARNAK